MDYNPWLDHHSAPKSPEAAVLHEPEPSKQFTTVPVHTDPEQMAGLPADADPSAQASRHSPGVQASDDDFGEFVTCEKAANGTTDATPACLAPLKPEILHKSP